MNDEILDWLLEPDRDNPGVRYFGLQQLLGRPADDPEVVEAQADVMRTGPVPKILGGQSAEGWWERPGSGYSAKYRGTVWQLIALERLGADGHDERIATACEYVLQHAMNPNGAFGWSGRPSEQAPGDATGLHCLNGNLTAALVRFGWLDDERLQRAIDWEARSITGEAGFAYYKSGTSGPGFCCGSNAGLPCSWGANKALRGLLAIPEERRGASVRQALDEGARFLLSCDVAAADYPRKNVVSPKWFRFGLPISYWSDVIETLEVVSGLGFGGDERVDAAFDFVLSKRDGSGRWRLDDTLNGRTRAPVEVKGEASKWVTLRALSVLRASGRG